MTRICRVTLAPVPGIDQPDDHIADLRGGDRDVVVIGAQAHRVQHRGPRRAARFQRRRPPSRASPGSSARGPSRAHTRGRTTCPGWSPRRAAASYSHRRPASAARQPRAVTASPPAQRRSRATSIRPVVHRVIQGAMPTPGAPGPATRPPGSVPARSAHSTASASSHSSTARAARHAWKSARKRDSTASGPVAASSGKLSITAFVRDLRPLARTNDHAKAVLTHLDTPGSRGRRLR